MTAPVLQMKQKRERVRPDGLPESSSSDERKEKQSSNTCQALNGMNWGAVDEERGRARRDNGPSRCRRGGGGLRKTISLQYGSRC